MAISLSDERGIELRVKKLKASGKSISRIISLTGVPRSKVRDILRNNGFLKPLGGLRKKNRRST
ncbi:hypothetical protein SAMN05428952_100938 [Nitrosomonas sp. Nm132]|nr:hypothetical protein SAMN05428952_100938 [Nitrosomonas sp. Nm132]